MAAIFLHCTTTEILWMRWWCDKGSEVESFRWRPISHRKNWVLVAKTPRDSTVMGTKWWPASKCVFLVFYCWALFTTTLASLVARLVCEGASVTEQVASRTSIFSPFQATIEIPSGCFPSDGSLPHQSSLDGVIEDCMVRVQPLLERQWSPCGGTNGVHKVHHQGAAPLQPGWYHPPCEGPQVTPAVH